MRDAALESNTQRNRILNAMSNADLALLQPHLERVTLKFGQSLQSPNKAITNLYFPESGIASLVVPANGAGRQAEIAIVGREGMTGLPVVHGTDRSPFDIFIQIEGDGHRIAAEKLREALHQSITLLRTLAALCPRLRYPSQLHGLSERAWLYRLKTGALAAHDA